MNINFNLKQQKPRKPYIMGKGKPNKYNKTSMDGHRVLANGSIVARTVMVSVRVPDANGKIVTHNVPVDESYDQGVIEEYNKALEEYNSKKTDKKA